MAKLSAFSANSCFFFIVPLCKFSETKVSEKKKLSEKIKEKENRLKKKQQELRAKELQADVSFCAFFFTPLWLTVFYIIHKAVVLPVISNHVLILTLWHLLLQQAELTPEEQLAEKLRVKKLQEDADLELAKDAFGKSKSKVKTPHALLLNSRNLVVFHNTTLLPFLYKWNCTTTACYLYSYLMFKLSLDC